MHPRLVLYVALFLISQSAAAQIDTNAINTQIALLREEMGKYCCGNCDSTYDPRFNCVKVMSIAYMIDTMENNKFPKFTSLKEAMKQRDAVRYLELRGRNFKKFPREVLQFDNLEILDLRDIAFEVGKKEYIYRRHPNSPPQTYRKLKVRENCLKEIPIAICRLKKPRKLYLSDTCLDRETLDGLKLLLPGCRIY